MTIIKMSEINESTIRTFDTTIELADNAMLRHRPDLFDQWDFIKNDLIGLDVYEVTKGSDKKVWWKCTKCPSSYDASISNKMQNRGCPYCRGYRINHTNSIAVLYPKLASQWHPTLNGDLRPSDYSKKNGKKVWWVGECGHEWNAVISSRTSGTGCPYCSSIKVLVGFNDMWTTNPELASLLANPDDGYRYMQNSSVKVDWKCLDCRIAIKDKKISLVKVKGLSCPSCSDGISFSEKFVYHLLISQKIKFEFQKSFAWSENKRYDFYLTDFNCIIETHGLQHYEDVKFYSKGEGTAAQQKSNDLEKLSLATLNNIDRYIVLDVRESSVEHIRKSLLSSDLREIISLDDINYYEIGRKSSSSFLIQSCELWNSKLSTGEIAEALKLSPTTIAGYLKKGSKYNLCDYSSEKAKKRAGVRIGTAVSKSVLLLNSQNDIVGKYRNMEELSAVINLSIGNARKYCNENILYNDLKIIYEKVYNKALSNGTLESLEFRMPTELKKVLQLDYEMNILKEWNSAQEAADSFNSNYHNISSACIGMVKSYKGFIWLYKDEFNKVFINGEYQRKSPTKYASGRKVVQFDLDLNFIREWETITDASKETKIPISNISLICKGGGKTAGGFKWMYKEDYYKEEVN